MNVPKRLVKLGWCLSAVVGLAAAAAWAGDSNKVIITADTPWVVAADAPEAVRRALADVERDWYKGLGHRPVVLPELPAGAESFVLRLQRDTAGRPALTAMGADARGAIYAACALAEEILGVDPWYYWVDKEPAFRERIEVPGGFEKRYLN